MPRGHVLNSSLWYRDGKIETTNVYYEPIKRFGLSFFFKMAVATSSADLKTHKKISHYEPMTGLSIDLLWFTFLWSLLRSHDFPRVPDF